MYIKQVKIRNIKSFANVTLNFLDSENKPRMWTTILGENGLGKSTLLQAIGAALAGPLVMRGLLNVEGWVRFQEPWGEIEIELIRDLNGYDEDANGLNDTNFPLVARYAVTGNDPEKLPKKFGSFEINTFKEWNNARTKKSFSFLSKTLYLKDRNGWLACGYGPFRRFSGSSSLTETIAYSNEKLARFLTLFSEENALISTTRWLVDLYNESRDNKNKEQTLNMVKKVLEKDLFPEPVYLDLNATEAKLRIGESNMPITLSNLSDGYRTMLAFSLDLLKWLTDAYPNRSDLSKCPGIIIIDELDAHMHPTWQRQIGYWLREKFPKLQFVIATHSPFLAQVTDTPEGNILLKRSTQGTQIVDTLESVNNWRVDQILTELFGMTTTRSPIVDDKLRRLRNLYLHRGNLNQAERMELDDLGEWATNIAPAIEDPVTRQDAIYLQEAVLRNAQKIKELE